MGQFSSLLQGWHRCLRRHQRPSSVTASERYVSGYLRSVHAALKCATILCSPTALCFGTMAHASGLKLRVPIAGMPKVRGIRASGEVPLKPWQNDALPPTAWVAPVATFEDPARQVSLARLLLTLKPVAEETDPMPHVDAAMTVVEESKGWSLEDSSAFHSELVALENQAQSQAFQLIQMRKRLHEVAFGELGIRTRRSDEQSSTAGACAGAHAGACSGACVNGHATAASASGASAAA
eukprot:6175825-Pleurochrysis_carterae.AAC.5